MGERKKFHFLTTSKNFSATNQTHFHLEDGLKAFQGNRKCCAKEFHPLSNHSSALFIARSTQKHPSIMINVRVLETSNEIKLHQQIKVSIVKGFTTDKLQHFWGNLFERYTLCHRAPNFDLEASHLGSLRNDTKAHEKVLSVEVQLNVYFGARQSSIAPTFFPIVPNNSTRHQFSSNSVRIIFMT